MIKSELLQVLIDKNPGLRSEELKFVLDTFFDLIGDHLAKGGRVEIRGFGAFSTRSDEPRKARNPRTGDAVAVPAKRRIHFKPGLELRTRLAPAVKTARPFRYSR